MVNEAEKSTIYWDFSWRTMTTHGVIQSKSEGLGIVRLIMCVLFWVWKPENQERQCLRAEDECLSWSRESNFACCLLFCSSLGPLQIGWYHSHWGGRGGAFALLSSSVQMLISWRRNTLTDTHRNNVLPASWASLRAVKLTCEINPHMHLSYLLEIWIEYFPQD